jgi:hypothetical protein
MILLPFPAENPAAVPDVRAAVQENVVPGTEPDRVIPVLPPVQNVCDAGVAIASGIGLTVTVISEEEEHPFISSIETV